MEELAEVLVDLDAVVCSQGSVRVESPLAPFPKTQMVNHSPSA